MGPLPPRLQEHFCAPRHVGATAGADGLGRARNAACGDRLELGLWCDGGLVSEARFQARGCSATIAVASLVADEVAGRTLEEAASLDVPALLEGAGGLPAGKAHAAALVERALTAALGALRARYP